MFYSDRSRPKFETGRRASGWRGVIGRQRRPDAEAVEGAARRVIRRCEAAMAPNSAESAWAVAAKNAGHDHWRRRRGRAGPVPVRDGRTPCLSCDILRRCGAAVLEFVVQSASHRRQILDLAISCCQFDT
jgi:hypothetical protein